LPKKSGFADHTMIGGNVYVATRLSQDDDMVKAETASLQSAIALDATRVNDVALVKVMNRGAGHSFPTGVSDLREPWIELQAMSADGKTVARFGGPDDKNLIPASAARLGMDLASSDGTLLLLHELNETTRIPFERRVPALGEIDLTLKPPATLPAGADHLDAVLLYRNVRTPYLRAATGNATDVAPEVEVARTPLH
jgi:hypothetical protein